MNLVLGEHFGWLHSARVCGSEIQRVGGLSGVHMHAAFAYGVPYTWCLWIIGTNIYFPEEKSWFYVYGSDLVQTVLCQRVWMLLCSWGTHPAGDCPSVQHRGTRPMPEHFGEHHWCLVESECHCPLCRALVCFGLWLVNTKWQNMRI